MSIAKVAFPVTILFLVNLASEARYHSRLWRVLRSGDESLRAWESLQGEEQNWDYEQCRFVNAWKEHLGYVSVLAFLDPAWHYSFRQAVMLELLSLRLRKSGFSDIRFFAISPPSNSMENEESSEDEANMWRDIEAQHETDSFVDHDFFRSNGSEIIFLKDDLRFCMWERFHASRDQVIIIDRCGKLTYHVIVPWSILFFPYVKAAILSTYEEDPCGGCDPAVYRVASHAEHVVKLTKLTDEEETSSTHQSKTNADIDEIYTIRTTENLANAVLHDELSKEEGETSTALFIPFEEITNVTDRSNILIESSTESTTYWYDNGTTESRFDENRSDAESMRDRENLTNSQSDNTISGGTTATFELQRDVLTPEQMESHPISTNNNSLIFANHEDRTLLLDEPATDEIVSDSTYADVERTTMSNLAEIQDRNTTPENTERFGEDAFLPLRIIMYAPHVHKNDRKMKKHTHLILKTGEPDFHGHLDFEIASSTDSPRDIDSDVTNSEEYNWETIKADANEKNANQKYMFDKDESPGLHGEVADYWKSYEDFTDRNETFNNTYNSFTAISDNEEHRINISNHATNLSKSEENYTSIVEDPNVKISTDLQNIVGSDRPINVINQIDRKEELQDKLIEHYKKLLPWIDYRLNK